MTKNKIIIAVFAVLAVIVAVLVYRNVTALTEEDVIDMSIIAVMTDDIETVESLMYTPIIESGCELEDITSDELVSEMLSVEDFYDSEDDFTYEINDKVYMADDYPDDLEDIEDTLSENLEDIGMDIDFEMEDALYASVTVTSSDGDDEDDYEFVFYEIDDSWYLLGVE